MREGFGLGMLDEQFFIGLAVKMLLAAAVVVIAAKVVERTDAFLGAMIATLPISAGPSYVFLAWEHGDAFVAESARVSATINTGSVGFIVVYSFLAQRFGGVLSTLGGLAIWLGMALLLSEARPPLVLALAINLTAVVLALALTRRLVKPDREKVPMVARWWDVPFRACVVMVLMALVLIAARLAGPQAAGIGALMPMVFASLTLILHPRIGGPATAEVMINSIIGMFAMALALVTVHLTAVPLGSPAALSFGLMVCVAWNTGLTLARQARFGRTAGA